MRNKRLFSNLSEIILVLLIIQMIFPLGNININASENELPNFDPFQLRVNVNGDEYTDKAGQIWLADQQYSEGSWGYTKFFGLNKTISEVEGTEDDELYQSHRMFSQGEGYKFELPSGSYEVNLKFMDDWSWQKEQRQFDILLNNETVKNGFDIFDTCGKLTACDQSFHVQIEDGLLEIGFDWNNGAGWSVISAIEIIEYEPLHAPELMSIGYFDHVLLQWDAIEGAETYTVLRRDSTNDFEVLLDGITETDMRDFSVEFDEVYYYVVYAEEKNRKGKTSNEVSTFLLDAELNGSNLTIEWPKIDKGAIYNVSKGPIDLTEHGEEDLEFNNHQIIADLTDNRYSENLSLIEDSYYYFVKVLLNGDEISSSYLILNKDLIDSDGDGLPDYLEIEVGSDPNNPDTNNNGISDGYEYNILLSDPSDLSSTVADEDFDNDGLTNLEEYQLDTDPWSADTDGDGLSDGDEVNIYGSDPLNPDTDGDGIMDGDEIYLGIDPTKQDTDGNGILDGDEYYEVTTEISEELADPNFSASVKMTVEGSKAFTTLIRNVEGEDAYLSEEIAGYIGAPYDFTTDASFNEAEMTFTFDESLINGDDFEPAIFWYNEDEGLLEELENQTIDWDNLTITATVEHFSTYILLNRIPWDEVWGQEFPQPERDENDSQKLEIVFTIDSSGSMTSNDPQDLRKVAVKNFIDKLLPQDRAAVVDFDSTAKIYSNLTSDKEKLKQAVDRVDSRGGTNLTVGLQASISELINNGDKDSKKHVIFLTDGDGAYSSSVLNPAIENDITVHTIGLGKGVKENVLQSIAEATSGKYYFASTDKELEELYDQIGDDTLGNLSIVLACNGGTVTVNLDDPYADTDGDGLTDMEELGQPGTDFMGRPCYHLKSHPNKVDTDGDGYSDKDDLFPFIPYETPVILLHGLTDNTENIYGATTAMSLLNSHYIDDNVDSNKTINRSKTAAKQASRYFDYYDGQNHQIINVYAGNNKANTPVTLANELKTKVGYVENKTLFALNYPNRDFNWKNADILKWYIEEHLADMKSLYSTKQAYNDRELKVNIIGHSNGGLVARYYIENLHGSRHVDKLITLNTPHWGSGIAIFSKTFLPNRKFNELEPLHFDLHPDGNFYGGNNLDITLKDKTKENYIIDNQSESLKFNNHGNTEYYFIAAHDNATTNFRNKELSNRTFNFDVIPNSDSFTAFRNSIASGFFNKYPQYQSDVRFTFKDNEGDNVVNNQSQLGVTYKKFGNGKNIRANAYFMLIDTIPGHGKIGDRLHGEIPKRTEATNQVIEYLTQ